MERLPLLLVGCGMMGARHMRGHAELERTAPGYLDLVAVCDRDEALANAVADEAADLLGRRPQVFCDLAEAAAKSGAVAADVVTPNRTHDDLCELLFSAGLHVLLEKPFAVTIARGRRILAAAERSGCVLGVAENNRRDPVNRLCRAAVQAGLIGEVVFADMTHYQRGGGVCGTPWRHQLSMGGLALDVWIHLAYMLEFLAGPIDQVWARAGMLEAERVWQRPGQEPVTVPCNSPDWLTAAVAFANGASGTWTTHFASSGFGQNQRVIFGTRGSMETPGDRSGQPVRIRRGNEVLEGAAVVEALPDWQLPEIETRLWGARPAGYQQEYPITDRKLLAAELADFIDAVRTGSAPEVSGEVGLRSVAIIYAMLESAAAGQAVSVAEVLDGRVSAYQQQVEAGA